MRILNKMSIIISIFFFSSNLFAAKGFLKSESVSGMNKICYYDVLGDVYTLNIKSNELCPLTYEF